jgi:hypothetical protein
MKSRAHIAMYAYFPAIIFYMLFADDGIFWGKFYFAVEKMLLCALLFDYFQTNIFKAQKNIAIALLLLQIMFILYIVIDWNSEFNYDYLTALMASLLYIVALTFNFFSYDRKRQR